MMQTRARSSRRNKVNVRWLPAELIIEIFRRVQKLIGRREFSQAGDFSMELDQEYYYNLVAFALGMKEWTAIAQAELFRTIILKNRREMDRFLEALRGSEKLRELSRNVTTLNLGRQEDNHLTEGLGVDLDEIALYCPSLVDVTCWSMDVRLEYFRNMKKLDKLKISCGSILAPSTPEAPVQPFILPITLLRLSAVYISSTIDSRSLPLVRSLHLCGQAGQPIRLLLPQLASLQVIYEISVVADLGILIQQSTSIISLSIREAPIVELDDASKTIIKERIVDFRLLASAYGETGGSTLTTIISGSKAMKKVILDGFYLRVSEQVRPKLLGTLEVVKEACKKKQIELWKENFEVGNGKVDLGP